MKRSGKNLIASMILSRRSSGTLIVDGGLDSQFILLIHEYTTLHQSKSSWKGKTEIQKVLSKACP